MTIFKHYCLDGEHRTGQELDCTVCRVLLLEAFRRPAAAPAPEITSTVPVRLPHLVVPDSYAETVDMIAAHTTQHGASSAEGEPGGVWWATCTCGWEDHGQYAASRVLAALRVAKQRAVEHEKEAGR